MYGVSSWQQLHSNTMWTEPVSLLLHTGIKEETFAFLTAVLHINGVCDGNKPLHVLKNAVLSHCSAGSETGGDASTINLFLSRCYCTCFGRAQLAWLEFVFHLHTVLYFYSTKTQRNIALQHLSDSFRYDWEIYTQNIWQDHKMCCLVVDQIVKLHASHTLIHQ